MLAEYTASLLLNVIKSYFLLNPYKALQLTHAAVVSKVVESARFKLGLWRPAFPVSDGSHRSEVTSVKCEAPNNTPSKF